MELDRLADMTYTPDNRPEYLQVHNVNGNIGDYEELLNLTSGTHQLNAYAIIEADGWASGTWQVTRNVGNKVSHLLIYQSLACFTDLSIAGMFY